MIYLDHNATTPPLPEVIDAMTPYIETHWANTSSVYRFSSASKNALNDSRRSVADCLNAPVDGVIFTSGATESINSAVHSAILLNSNRRHIVTSVVEHSATLGYCDYLEQFHGVEVTRLNVDASGQISLTELASSIRPDTALVSLIWANNETGVILPVSEVSEICRKSGVPLHLDAVQAVGRIPVDFINTGAAFMSISAHKVGAVKGCGCLLVADPKSFQPFIRGGKQEGGKRGGTESIPLIVGFSKALELTTGANLGECERVLKLRESLETELLKQHPTLQINGVASPRLPNTTSLHIPGVDNDAAVTYLDQKGICVSSGSACLESAIAPSHVILAMSNSHEVASETIRISMGRETTEREVEVLLRELKGMIEVML